tara:strand:- start:11484 stop:11897 length:414 start_codon:yes stop_codon:yes gene_type:complete
VKLLINIFTLVILLSSQAFGASLCPSICDTSSIDKSISMAQSELPPCHRSQPEKQPLNNMPDNCEVMNLLKILSSYHLNIYSLDANFSSQAQDILLSYNGLNRQDFNVTNHYINNFVTENVLKNNRPIYLLIQKYII